MRLDDDSLPDLARGCAILGAGGGGQVDLTLQMARYAVAEHGPVEVLGLDELDDGALILPCGLVGSPSIADERIPSGDEASILRAAVQRRSGRAVTALMPYEIGGANGVMPVVWAARLGLPLVDADAMGRSFPSLTQVVLELVGHHARSWLLADGRGNVVSVEAADRGWVDRLVRGAATGLGGVCAAALGGLGTAEARAGTVGGSMSRARACGAAPDGNGVRLLDGRVVDVLRRREGPRLEGTATIQGTAEDERRRLRVELQGEYLLVLEEGSVLAAVPDIIVLLAVPSGMPIPTGQLRRGQRVHVVALPAPEVWKSAEGLAVAGPQAFGLAIEHAPITPEARAAL
ncbi:MAG: uncharacterized protein QOF26_3022 [Baekduia sp.]|nr:uncharacterized protein [Baekduia sp.]